jgi:hypothetical protein
VWERPGERAESFSEDIDFEEDWMLSWRYIEYIMVDHTLIIPERRWKKGTEIIVVNEVHYLPVKK